MTPDAANRQRLENYVKLQAELRRREERALYEGDFRAFVEAGWSAMDSSEFQDSWAMDALCEHLTAVTRGDIKRLLINFPPRCGKSNVASIAWPAWTWAQSEENIRFTAGPQVRFLCGSYGHTLSLKLSTATRRLLTSPFYQRYWADRFELMGDQNAKHQYDNTKGGSRIATSIGGSLIGLGGDVICVDDPHNTEQVESDADRETVLRWWKELRSTRLNDPKRTAIVVVMQRLHEEDVSGAILQDSEDWTHLMLPMRHDPERHCVTVLKWDEQGEPEKTWEDPRNPFGKELLWFERYGEREVKLLEEELGPYMASGRLQQAPQPDGGGIIKREYWQLWEETQFPPLSYVWGSADTAYTEKEQNDPTGFTCWGLWHDQGQPKVIMLTAWRKRLEIHGPNTWLNEKTGVIESIDRQPQEKFAAWVARTQAHWGLCEWLAYSCTRFNVDKLLIESKASGLSVAQELRRLHGSENWGIELVTPEGDKTARLVAVQATFSAGLVYAPDRDWSQQVIDEVSSYPKGKFKDLTDSTSQALKHVRDIGLLVRPEERRYAEEAAARHKPASVPLYPA